MEEIGTATYSPEDNKLRLYPLARLSKDLYERVHAAGFIWAPKQELFVAPMWTPSREALLVELCGEVGDEDKSLVERAEERSERFEDYSESRADDARQARQAVSAIADNIPLGQPILVGSLLRSALMVHASKRSCNLWPTHGSSFQTVLSVNKEQMSGRRFASSSLSFLPPGSARGR